jgi:SEFIR domain
MRMERQVFISYAAGDKDWTAERVAEFAERLDTLQVRVHLDVRHQRSVGEKLAIAEWWDWMEVSMASATYVVCLCSDRYAEAWKRKESVSGGCGVAFESTKIVDYLYDEKQNNKGRVLTVVGKSGHRGMIPTALKTVCPYYQFGDPEDDLLLWSHLSQGSLTNQSVEYADESEIGESVKHSSSTVGAMLRHQADHAAELLSKCPELWRALQCSEDLKDCLNGEMPSSPLEMMQSLTALDADTLQEIMAEVRDSFSDIKTSVLESQNRVKAAEAVVATYLVCVCLLIRVQSPSQLSGLPQLDSEYAANLLACLIGTAMAGGKLVLVHGNHADLPVAQGALAVQLTGGVPGCEPKDEFERNLHTLVVVGSQSHESGLKVGELSRQERASLVQRLKTLRKTRRRTLAMSVVLFAKDAPPDSDTALVTDLKIPVFSMHHEVAYELLGGLSAEDLLAMLGELWRVVGEDMRSDRSAADAPQPHGEADLKELVSVLRALAASLGHHAASKEIQANAEALQRAVDEDSPPRRDVLAKTRETLDGLNHVGESAEKLIPRLLQLLNYFF